MAEHAYGLLCKRIIKDRELELDSFIDVFERITLQPKTSEAQSIEWPLAVNHVGNLCFRYSPEKKGSAVINIEYTSPDGNQSIDLIGEQEIYPLPGKHSFAVNIDLSDLVLFGEGTHWFAMRVLRDGEWLVQAKTPLTVEVVSARDNSGE